MYKRLNPELEIPDIAPEGHLIVAIGPYIWGSGKTIEDALKNMHKANYGKKCDYILHVLPDCDLSPVTEYGSLIKCAPNKNCPYCK